MSVLYCVNLEQLYLKDMLAFVVYFFFILLLTFWIQSANNHYYVVNNIFFRILYSNELYYCTQNCTVIGHFAAKQPLLYDFDQYSTFLRTNFNILKMQKNSVRSSLEKCFY
jgi:hypothetical protein